MGYTLLGLLWALSVIKNSVHLSCIALKGQVNLKTVSDNGTEDTGAH